MKKGRKWLPALLALVLLVGAVYYVNDGYSADETALAALESTQDVTVEAGRDRVVFLPEAPEAGLVFYPGGKVEFTAYAPLMQALARENILCVLLKMPLDLAVLDVHAAAGIPEAYPQISEWYLAGHSLGGSMAASHLAGEEHYDGLILLAAYSTEDLSASERRVLSIYGSEDGVLNLEKYRKNLPNLPQDAVQILLEGGNHAGFGSYGPQEGDGTASLPAGEQLRFTAGEIAAFIKEG